MDAQINRYELSAPADRDLGEIYDYTEFEYGKQQAVTYLKMLEETFRILADRPAMGRRRNEIRDGLRSVICQQHVIFYAVRAAGIRIVRVLHGNRDIPKHF
jgi:toxin ParE1/3/4